MKKGISIWSLPDLPLEDAFILAKKAGFEGVELALDESGELNLDITEKELTVIREKARRTGITLYSIASSLYWRYPLTDDDAVVREKAKEIVRKQLKAAKSLGCDTILVVPGTVCADFVDPNKVVDYQAAYERSLASLTELKGDAERLGVDIGIENVWNRFLLSPLEMRDFIDKAGSSCIGSYFDVGNVLYDGYPDQWIRILGSRIRKVHIKDFRKAAGESGFVDLLAGDVDFPEVIKALQEVGYDGWITAEMGTYRRYNEVMVYHTSHAMDRIMGRR